MLGRMQLIREGDMMNQEDKETQALRAALEYRQLQVELNRQILQNVFKATDLKPEFADPNTGVVRH